MCVCRGAFLLATSWRIWSSSSWNLMMVVNFFTLASFSVSMFSNYVRVQVVSWLLRVWGLWKLGPEVLCHLLYFLQGTVTVHGWWSSAWPRRVLAIELQETFIPTKDLGLFAIIPYKAVQPCCLPTDSKVWGNGGKYWFFSWTIHQRSYEMWP